MSSLINWGGVFIALIDDFKNDLQPGYGFDEYRTGTFIGKQLLPLGLGLRLFVPSIVPEKEGLGRRGTAYVLSNNLLSKYPDLDLNGLIEIRLE